ncbi:AT-rich interaction domain 6 [Colossoma macropomum]|uniref:AT-rich interaction domain 6 n=1 Tax=Colossoma macropomum TaxID=42526 RepID=UPI001864D575|nr:AT-rich interaction domain 6 [Colossoma macropomum]
MEPEEQIEKKNGEKREEREEREDATEESFLKDLYFFMKQRDTPIERIPHLGFKQIDLYLMFKTVKDLGGYHQVTTQQLWKKVYNILGGNPRSTSAATCTRRHYEKLLLPYEYHLAGYGDDIPITPPRKHKLPLSFDDQYLLNPKRALIRHALSFNQSTPHDFMTDGRVRIISMSDGVPHPSYLHPGPTSLPSLFSVPQPMPPIPNIRTPFHTRNPLPYLPPSSFETESFKQPLDRLRLLAKEYKSSSGLVEPLNLSKKTGKMEMSSNTPSSFSPPASKKLPKFLNEALPLYLNRADQPGTASGPSKADAPAQAVVNPMIMDESHAVNLTSSSRSSPTTKKAPCPTPLLDHGPSYPGTFPVKQSEKSLHDPSAKAGPSDMHQSSPSQAPSQAPSRPSLDPYGGMEIQIPLSLLQNWIKEGLISSLVSSRQNPSGPSQEPKKTPSPLGQGRRSSEASEGLISNLVSTCQQPTGLGSQDPNKTPSSPDSLSWGRTSSDSSDSSSSDLPADLSLRSHARDPANPGKPDSRSIASLMTGNESQLPTINRYASVKPFFMPPSPKMPFSRDPYHRVSHIKTVQDHDASLKQANSTNTKINSSTGPRPPGYDADFGYSLAARLGKAVEKAPTFKMNSASSPLIHLTPEHLKLLLASSPFRQEREKIC